MQIERFHHMTLPVPDIEAAAEWYRRILNGDELKRTGWKQKDTDAERTRQIFINAGQAVVNLAEGEPIHRPDAQHFFHYAFLARVEDMDAWIAHLTDNDVPIYGPYGHGGSTTVSVYFDDPYGYRLELVFVFPDAETARAEALQRGGKLGNPNNEYTWGLPG